MVFRAEVWGQLVGNHLKINAQMFDALLNDSAFHMGSQSDDKNGSLIVKDIPRAFPHLNKLFEEIHSLSQSLIDVLGAF